MNWAFMICPEMFGSGVRMGMVITLPQGQQIPKGHHRVIIVCSAAAAGSATLMAAVLRTATGSIPPAGTATSGSGLFSLPVRRELRQAGAPGGEWSGA